MDTQTGYKNDPRYIETPHPAARLVAYYRNSELGGWTTYDEDEFRAAILADFNSRNDWPTSPDCIEIRTADEWCEEDEITKPRYDLDLGLEWHDALRLVTEGMGYSLECWDDKDAFFETEFDFHFDVSEDGITWTAGYEILFSMDQEADARQLFADAMKELKASWMEENDQ